MNNYLAQQTVYNPELPALSLADLCDAKTMGCHWRKRLLYQLTAWCWLKFREYKLNVRFQSSSGFQMLGNFCC